MMPQPTALERFLEHADQLYAALRSPAAIDYPTLRILQTEMSTIRREAYQEAEARNINPAAPLNDVFETLMEGIGQTLVWRKLHPSLEADLLKMWEAERLGLGLYSTLDLQQNNTLCASVAKAIDRVKDQIKSLKPKSPGGNSRKLDARNKWIYEQCCAHRKYVAIWAELNKKCPDEGWSTLGSPTAIRKAAARYAEVHDRLPIPSRQNRQNK